MIDHKPGSREEWLVARDALLIREKEHTRLGDELARQRRELPWVPVEKEYRFQTDLLLYRPRVGVPDGVLPDPRSGTQGPRRGRLFPVLDSPARRVSACAWTVILEDHRLVPPAS
jgi:Bacterial protein of unknown function (DUF899)